MKKSLLSKILAIVIIIVLVGVSFVSSAVDIITDNDNRTIEKDDSELLDKEDFGLGFILCTVSALDQGNFEHYPFYKVRNVKFELTDYDTGEIIQEKFRSFGIHLFTFLPRGHSYVIKASFSEGSDTYRIGALDFFYWAPINIIYI